MDKERAVVDLLIGKYEKNGHITEDEIFDACEEYDLELSSIDRVGNQLNMLGVLIADTSNGVNTDEDEYIYDHSKTDYELIYEYFCAVYPGMAGIISYIRNIQPPQNKELSNLLSQYRSGNVYARTRLI